MITIKQLEEWKKICDDASEGPWEADIDDIGTPNETWTGKFYTGPELEKTWCTYNDDSGEIANARFCAMARTALPELIDFVKDQIERKNEGTKYVESSRKAR